MKLTTLNLWAFVDWEKRHDQIVDYLKTEQPDVTFFQEVVFIPEISSYNQAQLLNQSLGYPYELSSVTRLQDSPSYETYREGLAVLSKFPIQKSDTIVLKKQPGDEHNRIIQLFDLQINDTTIGFANVHFSLTDVMDYATEHLKETLEIIHSRNEKRIIVGDFNISHLEQTKELWQDDYSASTDVPYISFPDEQKRIDYCLVPREWRMINVQTSPDGLSDHRAVTVELETN